MNLHLKRKAKIICTLGPASHSEEQISALILAGMDVARLNFSHGTHEEHAELIAKIRACAQKINPGVSILQDLQGPKLRLGSLASPLQLKAGEQITLYPEHWDLKTLGLQNEKALPLSQEIAESTAKSLEQKSAGTKPARVLFDDGKILTHLIAVDFPKIKLQVQTGGVLKSHKGLNLPDTPLLFPTLTEKDKLDALFGLKHEVDAIALSFVREKKDILDLKHFLKENIEPGKKLPLIIAKMERPEALTHQDEILSTVDGLLIARGDMAVEISPEKVPSIQKKLIQNCNSRGIPVITATQMLESMIVSQTPTRAEASDVANAIFDGTDAVMLSAETAAGAYPVESVQTMSRIVLEAEKGRSQYSRNLKHEATPGSILDAIERSAASIADQIGAKLIVCFTHSGNAALSLAKYRADCPMVAFVENESILRRLSFIWGVRGEVIGPFGSTDQLFHHVDAILRQRGWAEALDWIVLTAGIPSFQKGTTNMVKVHQVA